MRKTTQYPALEERNPKNNQQRSYQRHLDTLKNRHEAQKNNTNRKHNSPDYNKYRTQDPKINPRLRTNPRDQQREQPRPQRREEEQPKSKKSKQLAKTSSSPALDLKQLAQQENEDYKKLHQKLNLIETKISDMKRHVQRKREQKALLLQNKKNRQMQREQQQPERNDRNNRNGKVDLKMFVTSVPQHNELHSFQNNPYSPRHDLYYVSEIIKSYKDDKSLGREHLLTSLHIFKVLENSRFATDEEMRQREVHLPVREGFQGKKTVVFDLDQTLIHCNDTLTPPFDVKLPITFPTGEIIEAGINIRPYAQQILKNLSRHFEVIVFTASHSCYANVVLDHLDPTNQYIHHRLFRDHCYQTPEGMYCKDLRVLDRDLTKMVLVDNAAYSYAAQPDNGIPILPYYQGKHDFQLKALQRYLQTMINVPDVREVNRQTFQFHLYRNFYTEPEQLVQEIYMQQQG